jgi:hypothetical protein
MNIIEIVSYVLEFLIETGFLLLALWFMVRIQKFQYTFIGLLGSAALASALDMIPYVGHYIAVPVLYICLLKVTREDLVGVVFTSAISYALVFGMNLFVLASLMGDLRASARERDEANPLTVAQVLDTGESDVIDADDRPMPPTSTPAPATTQTADHASTAPDPSRGFVLKGVINTGSRSTAMISAGGKTYTLMLGESTIVQTATGRANVTLEKVGESSATINIGGSRVELRK